MPRWRQVKRIRRICNQKIAIAQSRCQVHALRPITRNKTKSQMEEEFRGDRNPPWSSAQRRLDRPAFLRSNQPTNTKTSQQQAARSVGQTFTRFVIRSPNPVSSSCTQGSFSPTASGGPTSHPFCVSGKQTKKKIKKGGKKKRKRRSILFQSVACRSTMGGYRSLSAKRCITLPKEDGI